MKKTITMKRLLQLQEIYTPPYPIDDPREFVTLPNGRRIYKMCEEEMELLFNTPLPKSKKKSKLLLHVRRLIFETPYFQSLVKQGTITYSFVMEETEGMNEFDKENI